ncbi:sphingosine N-acyltransferase LAG1 [Dichotomopilus funicola]|uniref:Sphingosine N-acyltransferase LAG1 n=1 Tax=Dichotomopilus funicola TaxID=1934379 RepID=A0AAN6UZV1_9PEZI|nr:sphingosine N-acyltransferase LAG1 [Dichotomopilus funicola]
MPSTEALSLVRPATPSKQAAAANGGAHRRTVPSKLRHSESTSTTVKNVRPGSSPRGRKVSGRRRQPNSNSRTGLLRRTWVFPLALVLSFVTLYAINPTQSNVIRPFLFLSYQSDSRPDQYGKGRLDFAFVGFYTVFLTFTREFIMQEILRPLARLGGIHSRAKQARFMEQMYTACYFMFAGPLGLYTMHQTPGLWYFNTRGMHEGYPHVAHSAVFKFYYLFQAAYWVQQAVVMLLGQEKPRKDFRELVAHHVLTITLIFLSYRYHFTYIGIFIYITHDVSDLLLAISKSLNYLSHPLQSYTFALCIAGWVYLRHYLNLRVMYSLATEYAAIQPFGAISWEREEFKSPMSQWGTFGLLVGLQFLNVFWLGCLVRAAYRFVVLGVAKDDREDGEEEVEGK